LYVSFFIILALLVRSNALFFIVIVGYFPLKTFIMNIKKMNKQLFFSFIWGIIHFTLILGTYFLILY